MARSRKETSAAPLTTAQWLGNLVKSADDVMRKVQVRLAFPGAQGVTLDGQGQLHLRTASGEVLGLAPTLYQQHGPDKVPVSGHYQLNADLTASFQVGSYDPSQPLVIDPVVSYSTFIGGSGNDEGRAVADGSDGTIYVAGMTASTNLPTLNPLQTTLLGSEDGFVGRVNTTTGQWLYLTYLGGSAADEINALALDSGGYAYVTGVTWSSDFPTTTGAYQTSGVNNAFVAKLNPTGDALCYATYLGSSYSSVAAPDVGYGIAVDTKGQAHVAGLASIDPVHGSNFPTTVGAFQTSVGGGASDAFVTTLSADGSALAASTLVGGDANEWATAIAVDAQGNNFLTGTVSGPGTTHLFPLVGAFQSTFGGGTDAFVVEVNATASSLGYASFLGGSAADSGSGIAVDGSGNAYVTGSTASTNFPLQAAYQTTLHGPQDAFVVKVAAGGASLSYATYVGGSLSDSGSAIAVDRSGQAFVTGMTTSTDFPLQGAFQSSAGGGQDAFVVGLNASGSALLVSSYLGGSSDDQGKGVAVNLAGLIDVTGWTTSSNFPTVNPTQSQNGGNKDAFLTQVTLSPAPPQITAISPDSGSSSTDFITTAQNLTLSGTAPANSTVTISRADLGVVGTATADANGNWTFNYTATTLAEGSYTFQATATLSGQTSAPGKPVLVTVDRTAPQVAATPVSLGYANTGQNSWSGYSLAPVVRVSATDRIGLPVNALATLDVDLNGDGNFTDAGETGYTTVTLHNGTAEVTLPALPGFNVPGAGQYTVRARVTDLAGNEGTSPNQNLTMSQVSGWTLVTGQPPVVPSVDPSRGLAQEELGNVTWSHALDLDLSPGTQRGGYPALVYNSSSVNVWPIVQAYVQSANAQALPSQVGLDFTWNGQLQGGGTQWHSTTGLTRGDALTLAAQVDSAVSQSGLYPWSITVHIPGQPNLSYSSQTFVRVEDQSPFGAGWTLGSLNSLVPVTQGPYTVGVAWLYGDGQSRLFSGSGNYTNPEDPGQLTFNGSVYTYTSPAHDQMVFDVSGRETSWTSPDGSETLQYRYDSNGRLSGTTAIDGTTSTFTYDSNGKLASIAVPGSRTYTITVSGGTLTSITDPDNRQEAFGYSGSLLTTETLGTGATQLANSWAYDGHGLLQSWKVGTSLSPDDWQLQPGVAVGLADPLVATGPRPKTTDPLGNVTLDVLDSRARLLQEIAADGGLTTWTRNSAGDVLTVTDPIGRVTSYQRDPQGYITVASYADGNVEHFSYDSTFHVLTSDSINTDPAVGGTVDSGGHLLTWRDQATNTWQFTWNHEELASITDPRSRTVTFNRDGLLRVTSVVDPLGTTTYGYDSYGSVNSVVDAKNQTWSAVNDALGRVLSTTDPTLHSDATTYTTAGLLQQYQDKENVLTKLQYDPYGQGLLQVTIDAAASVLARTVVSLFDAAGQETGSRAANGGWTTTQLSSVGLPLVVTDAVGDKEQYAYDWAGQMKTSRSSFFW